MGGNPTGPITSAIKPADIQTHRPFIAFKPDSVPPSQYVYLTENDTVIVNVTGNSGGLQVRVNYRYLDIHGDIKEGTLLCPIPNRGGFIQYTFAIGEGWLLSIGCQQTSAIGNAWAFAQIGFARSIIAAQAIEQGLIWQGYVPAVWPNGWPGTASKEITDGAGTLITIVGNTPAAGADISELMPLGSRRQLLAFAAQLTASAAVANRVPAIVIDDGANVFYNQASSLAQTAGQVITYDGVPGGQFFNSTQNLITIPLPGPLQLKTSYRIRTSTNGIQAGDQWTAPKYLVIEWGIVDT